MDAGTWVAVYAGVVATAALGWNVVRAILEQRTDVRLEVEHSDFIGVDEVVGYRIEVVARNFGPREVVEEAGFRFEPEDGNIGFGRPERPRQAAPSTRLHPLDHRSQLVPVQRQK